MELSTLIARHARYRPNHTAVIFKDQRFTYHEFNQRVNRLGNTLLSMGIRKGDKVATILPNCLEQLDAYWAAAKIGAVVVPLSPLLRGTGLSRLLNDSDTSLLITTHDFVEHLAAIRTDLPNIPAENYILIDGQQPGYQNYRDLVSAANDENPPRVEISGSDPYNIIYSSGTTGLPKGIIHTHDIRAGYCTLFASAYRIQPESILIHAGSIVFNGAFLTLMPAFYLGATYILMEQFDPVELINIIQREKVTHIKMVPSQIIAMLHAPNFSPDALQSLEMLGSVGAPLHMAHKEAIQRHLPGRFYELYGLTEGLMTILDKTDFEAKPNSVGSPPPFMEIRVVDENSHDLPPGQVGEIIGRSPLMMPGYYKRPDLTAGAIRDGWLYSGDLGYLDEDGFLYLVDRKKDMIISGGVNVYPRDIEEILTQHEAVKEVAIFGIPDEKWGETPIAAVIVRENVDITPEALRDWVNERVEARYQRVKEVVFLREFPRSTAGKTLKRIMRQSYAEEHQIQV